MTDEELIREIASKAFREALEARAQELAEDIAGRMKVAMQPAAAPRERTKALRDGSMLIAGSRTQTETLEALLAATSAVSDGCGLLILRGTQAGGWSCQGLTELNNFKRAVLDCSRGPVAAAIASCTPAETRASELDPVFVARLGLDAHAKVVLIPVLLKGHVAALLLALAPEGDEAAALEVLVQVAQLALDVQAYRKTAPKPVAEAHSAPPAQVVAPVVPPATATQSVQAEPTTTPAPQPAPGPAPAVEVSTVAAVAVTEAAAPAPAEPSVAAEAPAPEPAYVPVAKEPEPVAVSAAAAPVPEHTYVPTAEREPEAVSVPVVSPPVPEAAPQPSYAAAAIAPPPVVVPEVHTPEPAPVAAPAFHEIAPSPSGTPDPAHEKARRFAKLLVEEIKLYNQSKVAEGRARGDLYSRLREDIEKSRAAYQKRYGETVRDVDYFTQELMRILAENNRNVMGAGFPG